MGIIDIFIEVISGKTYNLSVIMIIGLFSGLALEVYGISHLLKDKIQGD